MAPFEFKGGRDVIDAGRHQTRLHITIVEGEGIREDQKVGIQNLVG